MSDAYQPTEKHRGLVWTLAQRGLAPADIVLLLEHHDRTVIDEETLAVVFDWELRMGRAQANLALAERLHKSAESGNVTAQIFLSKVFLGWTEKALPKPTSDEMKTVEALPDEQTMGKILRIPGKSSGRS